MGFQNGMVIMVWRSLAGSLSYPDGYSYGLKEKRFGTPFKIDVADFVPKIFKELDRKGPRVSTPIGMKWKSVRCRYLWIFRSLAFSAVGHTMSTTVKSQAKGFPSLVG